MGKKKKKNRNGPEIYLQGENELDALLNGGITARVRQQLYKINEPKDSPYLSPPATFTPVAPSPLHCMMYRNFCLNCGASHDSFGFLSRMVTEMVGDASITRFKTVERPNFGETVKAVEYKLMQTPFCPTCLPDTARQSTDPSIVTGASHV